MASQHELVEQDVQQQTVRVWDNTGSNTAKKVSGVEEALKQSKQDVVEISDKAKELFAEQVQSKQGVSTSTSISISSECPLLNFLPNQTTVPLKDRQRALGLLFDAFKTLYSSLPNGGPPKGLVAQHALEQEQEGYVKGGKFGYKNVSEARSGRTEGNVELTSSSRLLFSFLSTGPLQHPSLPPQTSPTQLPLPPFHRNPIHPRPSPRSTRSRPSLQTHSSSPRVLALETGRVPHLGIYGGRSRRVGRGRERREL